jgi:hypothetical protein
VCLGHGRGSILHKCLAMHHMLALECGTWAKFVKARLEVRTFCSDQGAEKDVCDSSSLYDEGFGNVQHLREQWWAGGLEGVPLDPSCALSFFLPRCLFFADGLHVVYNGLEEAITASSEWEECDRYLKSIASVLANRDVRFRYMETCLHGAQAVYFANWSVNSSFNWKWEFLQRYLDDLVPVIDILISTFDVQKIMHAQTFSLYAAGHLQSVDLAVKYQPLKGIVLVLQAVCHGARRVAGWFEGCRCHEYLLRAGPGRPASARSRLLEYRAAAKLCVMGSRHTEWIEPRQTFNISAPTCRHNFPALDPKSSFPILTLNSNSIMRDPTSQPVMPWSQIKP